VQDKKKILIAEDYDEARALMALFLTRLGYSVAEACDGKEALEQVALEQPDLILMDISMPRMDGLEATALLKGDQETRHIPVLILTAHSQQSQRNNALNAGASDVLIKPLELAQLRSTLELHLQSEHSSFIDIGAPTTAEL